ncbi:HK97 gp10 family phage protein [Lactococcus lactis]|jgi:hypothetical protein|uniref:HK97 gp10 family phage protein n=1 Tax=Lactococcus lactis TaxID=1358 RepID=UPI0004E12237|nr:HK97 gp10 family phage protein [Lactococcus lactis]MDM7655185.1 HK97 gp10 family phage protein [Lactococcus lactis]OJH46925.1 hypothetical protein LGL2_07915 [Lactococcus lactis subsp. lactis bv. diacetylactis]TRW70919.1 hypothetical protein FNJ58_04150 [Lactococcus lactis]
MANKISLNELTSAIEKEVRNWTKDVLDDVNSIKEDIAKEGVNKLRSSSPVRTADYATNWTRKKIKVGNETNQIIYQKAPTYRLTHLLEKGHAKRNGGRVAPKVHIAPVEEELVSNYISRVEKRLSQ